MWTRCQYLSDLQQSKDNGERCLAEKYMYQCFFFFWTFFTDFFVLSDTLPISFGNCHEKAQKRFFSLHRFLWSPQKLKPQIYKKKNASGRESFSVEIKRKKVSVPTCLLFKVRTNHLDWKNILRKLKAIHDDAYYFFDKKRSILLFQKNIQRIIWVDFPKNVSTVLF